jgi:hypothetical protein
LPTISASLDIQTLDTDACKTGTQKGHEDEQDPGMPVGNERGQQEASGTAAEGCDAGLSLAPSRSDACPQKSRSRSGHVLVSSSDEDAEVIWVCSHRDAMSHVQSA